MLFASAALALAAVVAGCGQMGESKIVRVGDGTLTVSEASFVSDDESVTTYKVAADAQVIRDGQPADLGQLMQGDSVSIVAESRDGESVATKIEAQSPAIDSDPTPEPAPEPFVPEPIVPEPIVPEPQPTPEPQPLPTPEPSPEPTPEPTPEPVPGLTPEPTPGPAPLPVPPEPLPLEPKPEPTEPAEPTDPAEPQEPPAAEPSRAERLDGTLVSIVEGRLVLRDATGTEHALTAAEDVVVTIDDKEATMADLQADMAAEVTVERRGDTMVATKIDASGGE
jgi:hypothetical protein